MLLRLLILAIGTAGALTACGGNEAPVAAAAPNANTITIKGFAFGPASMHVSKGTTVTWTNSDPTTHTTTADKSDRQKWDSGNLSPNTSYAVVFTQDGTFPFHCDIHNYMTGTITVTG